jgi:hypothetical protein
MRPIIAGLFFCAASSAAAQTPRPETPEIATSGQGEVVLQPDHARLSLGIEVHAATAAAASAQVGARVQQARQAIRAKGFPLDSVRVTGFDVSPNYRFDPVRKLVDYAGRATVELTVRPVDRLAGVMDTALVSGINDISGIEFRSDSAAVARDRALALALEKARRDADALALAGGGRRGRLRGVTTEGPAVPYERMQGAMGMRAMAASGAPPVEREVVVSVSVQARWEFVPGAP